MNIARWQKYKCVIANKKNKGKIEEDTRRRRHEERAKKRRKNSCLNAAVVCKMSVKKDEPTGLDGYATNLLTVFICLAQRKERQQWCVKLCPSKVSDGKERQEKENVTTREEATQEKNLAVFGYDDDALGVAVYCLFQAASLFNVHLSDCLSSSLCCPFALFVQATVPRLGMRKPPISIAVWSLVVVAHSLTHSLSLSRLLPLPGSAVPF